MVNRRPKILILIKPFWTYPKHKAKFEVIREIEKFAEVYYWNEDGNIHEIIKKLGVQFDFIFQYDIAWSYGLAPKIIGLDQLNIPKGCFVIDLHWNPQSRKKYFIENKIDLIFSVTRTPFLKAFPQFKKKLRWLPWSINPDVMKDYQLAKSFDYLLMGLVYVERNQLERFAYPKQLPPKGRYAFRDKVYEKMYNKPGFMFHPHPGHRTMDYRNIIVGKRYAQELNRAKMFFTCGSRDKNGGITVQKFFEAPACRTLLMAEENDDLRHLGFIDGENFISCTTENFEQKAKKYLFNDIERMRITDNGYQLIHRHHTNENRARFFVTSIKDFLKAQKS